MAEISDIWGLEYALDNKARLEHRHHIRSVEGLKEGLDGKAGANHDHAIATVENPGFMSTADRIKLDSLTQGGSSGGGGATTIDQITGLRAELDGTAHLVHTHQLAAVDAAGFMSADDKAKLDSLSTSGGATTIEDVIGLQEALDSKAYTRLVDIENDGLMSAVDKNRLDSLISSGGGASTIAQVAGLQEALDGKAASGHTHSGLPNLTPQQLTYTASQSSTYGSTPAGTYANLTDGSFTTGTGTNSAASSWIKADLGAIKAVSQVWLSGGTIPNGWGTAAGYLNGSTLEVSNDDTTWAIAMLSIDQIVDSAVTRFTFGGGLLARYIRVRKNNNFIGAGEFRIFG